MLPTLSQSLLSPTIGPTAGAARPYPASTPHRPATSSLPSTSTLRFANSPNEYKYVPLTPETYAAPPPPPPAAAPRRHPASPPPMDLDASDVDGSDVLDDSLDEFVDDAPPVLLELVTAATKYAQQVRATPAHTPEHLHQLLHMPAGLTLHQHQVEGVQWLDRLRRAGVSGILADAMGLGKTIQSLCAVKLLLDDAKREEVAQYAASGRVDRRRTPRLPVLLLAPVSTISNWEREAAKWLGDNYRVAIYAGTQDERRMLRRRWQPGLMTHGASLDKNDIKKAATKYAGKELAPVPDAIVAPYSCLSGDDREWLGRWRWSALVLDEAQLVKSRTTQRYSSVMNLRVHSDWLVLLSGTPVQNTVQELMTLLAVVVVDSNRTGGGLRSLLGAQKLDDLIADVRAHEQMLTAGTRPDTRAPSPLNEDGSGMEAEADAAPADGDDAAAPAPAPAPVVPDEAPEQTPEALLSTLTNSTFVQSIRQVIDPFILRRTKEVLAGHLPPKTVVTRRCQPTPDQGQYITELNAMRRSIRLTGDAGDGDLDPEDRVSLSNIYVLMRRASSHMMLLRYFYTEPILEKLAGEIYNLAPADRKEVLLLAKNTVSIPANADGIGWPRRVVDLVKMDEQQFAAMCELSNDFYIASFVNSLVVNNMLPSAAPLMMPESAVTTGSGKVAELVRLMEESYGRREKMLVFSTYTTVLDILESVVAQVGGGRSFLRLDGSTQSDERQIIMDMFNNDTDYTYPIMLISTRAGGLGINLTAATRVVFYDVDVNPSVDDQAEDRAHRIGQRAPVEVVRLVTRGAVDDAIDRTAQRKRALINALIVGEVRDATMEEVLYELDAATNESKIDV